MADGIQFGLNRKNIDNMGLTFSDMNRIMYRKWKSEGLSDKEIDRKIPGHLRTKFWNDVDKTPFQSHFGMSERTALIIVAIMLLSSIFLALFLN